MNWTTDDMPFQTGRTAIVTGANSGIGFETAKALAAKGATVILACRSVSKGEEAADKIRAEHPETNVEVLELDLASLSSVRSFAQTFKDNYGKLELLINNAGVMVPPYGTTQDGFELQFGVNHLGHFALTGLLLDRLLETKKARVVNVSSSAHRMGELDFENFDPVLSEDSYKPWRAYGRSKLANLLFTLELQKHFNAAGTDTLAVAAHPGGTKTNLQRSMSGIGRNLLNLMMQEQHMGALPTLYAATAPDVQGNDYYGPDGFQEIRGYPEKVGRSDDAKNANDAKQLWKLSEELTGVRYDVPQPVSA